MQYSHAEINNPSRPHQSGSGGFMDMMKSQLLTMTMVQSMNSNHGGTKENQGGMMQMMYVFLVTSLIDFFFQTVVPMGVNLVQRKMDEASKATQKMINPLVSKDEKTQSPKKKTGSVEILVSTGGDPQNIMGQALLDFLTNHPNTKNISFKKVFMINQKDVIDLGNDLWVIMKTSVVTGQKEDGKNETEQQLFELYSYSKTVKEIRSFLDELSRLYRIRMENKLGDQVFYFNQHPTQAPKINEGEKDFSKLPAHCIFTMKPFHTNRKFTNLFGPEMNVIKKRVDFFLQRKEWYNEKGIPYTLGLLLSGQAGAGKTSTIKCLANETKRHIINLNLNNDISKTQMDNLFFNEMLMVLNMSTGQTEKYFIPLNQRIYVLEDIDCQSDLVMERELKIKHRPESQDLKPFLKLNTKTNPHKPGMYENEGDVMSSQAEKIDLSFLLNLLDGVLENPGRIVIMTSNYPEWLDHALIRPGRIDVIANFKKCTHKTIIEMMVFFFDLKLLTKEEEELICKLPEDLFSPAEMSKLMFEHMDDKNKVFEALYSFMPREFPNGTALHALPLAPLPPQNPIQSILKKEKTPVLVNESIDKIKNESNELKDLQNFDKSNEKNKNLHHTFHQSMFLDANINDDKNPVSSSFQSLESLKNKTTSKEAEVDPEPFSFSSAGAFEFF